MLSDDQKQDCLKTLVVPRSRFVSDEISTCKTQVSCFQCGGKVEVGTDCRVRKEVFGGSIRTVFFCEDCCVGYAALANGDNGPWKKHISEKNRLINRITFSERVTDLYSDVSHFFKHLLKSLRN